MQACRVLENGGVIVCPTDTIPGLSCLPTQADALRRILAIKQRPADKGLILISSQLALLENYIQPLTPPQRDRITSATTPTTWLATAAASVNPDITGSHTTLAIRLCQHEIVEQLCETVQQPLISTSANIHGQASAISNDEISDKVKDQVDLILSGSVGTEQASIIRRLDNDKVIRA